MRRGRSNALLLSVIAAAALSACSTKPKIADDEPTLASLAQRKIDVQEDGGIVATEEQTIAAYRKFLDGAPKAAQRPEALRRIGDLEMDLADNKAADAGNAPDYKAAIARYEDYLKLHPNEPGNDRVLYQLARAQEQSGSLEVSLKTLDDLVAKYPGTPYFEEVHFRRGELLFAMKEYPKAEKAYETLLCSGMASNFEERALYMKGWSQFKQGKLEEGLGSFFAVLDRKVGNRESEAFTEPGLDGIPGLSRADRELVEDTFRVTSLSLANLKGAESIPTYVTDDKRKSYEFRVYEQLAELYLKQERVKDAADTMNLFVRRQPLHTMSPQLQARVIEIYQANGFANLALDAKKEYVTRYSGGGEFQKANQAGWERAQPLVKTHLTELARHHHSIAQKNKTSSDYQEAVKWYRLYITSFPKEPETAQNHFLLAELLREDSKFAEASVEYERTAYDYPKHDKSADAGYSALLSYAGHEKRVAGAELTAVQRSGVESSLRFVKEFPNDTRASSVLTNAAERLYALGEGNRATDIAAQVLKQDPPADPALRRVAWTVTSHTAFERGEFAAAEKGYSEVLALTPPNDPKRSELTERLAASVYKQGEQARSTGKLQDAVGHFSRVASVAPQSSVRAAAQYDAAAAMIGLKDWDAAAKSLEDFRQRYPNHALADDVSGKLAVAYMERGSWAQAAGEFERLATTKKDPAVARGALWQAAELYDKGGARAKAVGAYERYAKQYPDPLETSLEARYRLARFAKADGNAKRELDLMKEIHSADLRGGSARTPRTQTLGGLALLVLAEPSFEAYRKVQLVEPLQRNLKLKKTRMEEVLKAYAQASNYGVADVTTAATFQTAALYQDFGKAMLTSQRPKGLKKAELEQYNVLLEEQAFPFEEKAIELHEINAKRAAEGIYNEWVKKSFTALGTLRPVRYGKNERSEGVVDAIR
jgi:outer membrane protein assembly factor BamD (BamD/ComL family)